MIEKAAAGYGATALFMEIWPIAEISLWGGLLLGEAVSSISEVADGDSLFGLVEAISYGAIK